MVPFHRSREEIMAARPKTLDVSDSSELGRLAEEVHHTGEARILRLHDEDLAVVMPITTPVGRRKRRSATDADVEAFHAAAGGWSAFDVDRFLEDNERSRRRSSRPAVEL
jgi:hypothetical protein